MAADTRVEMLRPGDQFDRRGETFDVLRCQTVGSTVIVTTDVPVGEPTPMADLDGETIAYQSHRTFLYPRGWLVDAATAAEMAGAS